MGSKIEVMRLDSEMQNQAKAYAVRQRNEAAQNRIGVVSAR
jgi:hypothetical protein